MDKPKNPPPAAGSIPAHGLSCPYCRSNAVSVVGDVFVEQGEYNGKKYDHEGDATHWMCGDCHRGFIEWTP